MAHFRFNEAMGRPLTHFWLRFQRKFKMSLIGCWKWEASKDRHGYGVFDGSRAHRVSFELYKGPIPAGYVIDHICRNPSCVNPEHLRAVTTQTNTIENSLSIQARNAAKTHCKHGHEFTAANTMTHTRGKGRKCRACHLIHRQKTNEKRRNARHSN